MQTTGYLGLNPLVNEIFDQQIFQSPYSDHH